MPWTSVWGGLTTSTELFMWSTTRNTAITLAPPAAQQCSHRPVSNLLDVQRNTLFYCPGPPCRLFAPRLEALQPHLHVRGLSQTTGCPFSFQICALLFYVDWIVLLLYFLVRLTFFLLIIIKWFLLPIVVCNYQFLLVFVLFLTRLWIDLSVNSAYPRRTSKIPTLISFILELPRNSMYIHILPGNFFVWCGKITSFWPLSWFVHSFLCSMLVSDLTRSLQISLLLLMPLLFF